MKHLQANTSVAGGPPASLIGHICVMSPPMTHGPGIVSTTTLRPPAHVPVCAGCAVAVGSENVGPAPQMILPGLAGVKNSCC